MLLTLHNVYCSIQISDGVKYGVACVLGAIVVLGVGFLPMDAIHNAAHDTRHSFAFPCHQEKELVMSDEDYTGEAIAMDGIEEEHQGDADVARYERSNRKVNPD